MITLTIVMRTNPKRKVDIRNSDSLSGVTKILRRFRSHTSSKNAIETAFATG